MMGSAELVKRDKIIVRRYLAGEAITVLADEYGVSRQRIYQIVKKEGAYRPRLTENYVHVAKINEADICTMRKAGKRWNEIEEYFCVSHETLRNHVDKDKYPRWGDANLCQCSLCKKVLPLDKFSIWRKHNSRCKLCANEYARELRLRRLRQSKL